MGGFNLGGALGGAMSGASTGSMFGMPGTLIGGALGAASGGMEQQGGGGGIQGSPADLPKDLGNDIMPPSSFAPPSLQSKLGTPSDEMSTRVRDHLLKQLRMG